MAPFGSNGSNVTRRRPALEGLVARISCISLVGLARSVASAPAPSDEAAATCPQWSSIAGKHCLCDAGLTCVDQLVGGRRCSTGHSHVHPVLGEQTLHGFLPAECPSCSCRPEVEAEGPHRDSAPGTAGPPGGKSYNDSARLVFIQYHKTGSKLSIVLMKAVAKVLNFTVAPLQQSKLKRACCPSFDCTGRLARSVQKWAAPELILSPAPMPPCHTVVHMVRDPARWALSWYDYHMQQPTPERWVEQVKPVCDLAHSEYKDAPFGLRAGWVNNAIAACRAIVERRPSFSVLQHLRALPEMEGIRFASLLNLLGVSSHDAGGDLMRSAANQVTIERRQGEAAAATSAPPGSRARVATLWMDEVVDAPEVAMPRLAAYLVDAVGETTPADAATLVGSLVSQLVSNEALSFKHASNGNHVTSHRSVGNQTASLKRRARLVAGLEADPIFTEAFAWWRGVFAASRE